MWLGRIVLVFDKWQVTIDSLPDIEERLKALKSERQSFCITHVGELRRTDNRLFCSKQAKDLLDFLDLFFSFTAGRRCECNLPFGMRYLKKPLFENWSPPRSKPGIGDRNWFSARHAQECMGVVTGLYKLWKSKHKRDWLKLVISLYCESTQNISGSELELTKAQIALELLSWVILHEEQAMISKEGLERLPAADRIRLLLSFCRIPLKIPDRLSHLNSAFKKDKDIDGPKAVTEIRNSIVHPSSDNRNRLLTFSSMAKFEAWQLSMFYIELILLFLFEYTGRFCNRLHFDREHWEVELVPWARP